MDLEFFAVWERDDGLVGRQYHGMDGGHLWVEDSESMNFLCGHIIYMPVGGGSGILGEEERST